MYSPTQKFKWRAFGFGLKILSRIDGVVYGRMKSGDVFKVPAKDYAGARLVLTGQWEPSVTAVVRHVLREGDVFVDVGANFGYFSIAAARWVGRSGRVIAFECAPRALDLLKQNVVSNACSSTVVVVESGLSDVSGDLKFFQSRLDTGWSSLNSLPDSDEISVSVQRFDELEQAKLDIRLIKIDVEGGESKVLFGMKGLFERGARPMVIVEITPRFAERGGGSTHATFDFLESFGYVAYCIPRLRIDYGPYLKEGFILSRTDAAELELGNRQEDVIFVPTAMTEGWPTTIRFV